MTVSTTTNKSLLLSPTVSPFTGPYVWGTWPVIDKEDIDVYLIDNAGTGARTGPLTITTDYTVDLGAKAVTLSTAKGTALDALTNGRVAIYRSLIKTQTSEFNNQGAFLSQAFEDAFDRQTHMIQEMDEKFNRCVQTFEWDSTSPIVVLPDLNGVTGGVIYYDGTAFQIDQNVNVDDLALISSISGDITTVASISADVTTVAADGADIGVVAGISSDVTTVSGISANVTTVAGNSANITTVAGIDTDVTTVAGISSDISVVSSISANVTTVAGDSADIQTVATDLNGADTIGSALGAASDAADSADNAAASAALAASSSVVSVDTIAALKALTVALNDIVNIEGHTTVEDGGAGLFRYNSGSSATDNNGTIIQPTTGSGRWIRQVENNNLEAAWFGVIATVAADQRPAIQAAIDVAEALGGGYVYLPAGEIRIDSGLVIDEDWVILKGRGTSDQHSAAPPYGTTISAYGAANPMLTIETADGASNHRIFGSWAEDIYFNGRATAVGGILVKSVNSCDLNKVRVEACTSYQIQTVGNTAGNILDAADVQHCNWNDIFINCSPFGTTDSADGMILDGVGAGGGNFSYNTIGTMQIRHKDGIGLRIRACDNTNFGNMRITQPSGTGVGCQIDGQEIGQRVVEGIIFHNIYVQGAFKVLSSADGGSFDADPQAIVINIDSSNNSTLPTVSAGAEVVLTQNHTKVRDQRYLALSAGSTVTAMTNAYENRAGYAISVGSDAGKHIRLATQDGTTSVWRMGVSQSTGDFELKQTTGSDGIDFSGRNLAIKKITVHDANGTEYGSIAPTGGPGLDLTFTAVRGVVFDIDPSGDLTTTRYTWKLNGTTKMRLTEDGTTDALHPVIDSDMGLGTNSLRWDKLWVDTVESTDGYTVGGATVIDGSQNHKLRVYTVGTLPSAGTAGLEAHASNGRKNGEGGGSGTGVQVFDDGSNWIAVDTGQTVAA